MSLVIGCRRWAAARIVLLLLVCGSLNVECRKRMEEKSEEETGEAGPEARSPGEGDWGN